LTTEEIGGLTSGQPDGNLPLARWTLNERDGKFVKDISLHNHLGKLEHQAVPNAAMVAANDTEAVKPGDIPSLEEATLAIRVPPPDREAREEAEVGRIVVQEEVKDDKSPEGVLKKNGLKLNGRFYVPESEDDVRKKVTEALYLAGRMQYHWMQKQAALHAERRPRMIKELDAWIGTYQNEIRLIDDDMNYIQGRKIRGEFFNILEKAYFNELTVYKSGLQEELRQARQFLQNLMGQQANPQWDNRNEESAMADQRSYDEALREARKLVNATNQKIAELKKNDEVKKALAACRKNARQTIVLGKSEKFAKNVTDLENLERKWMAWGKR
jgi:hypothetical protein